MCEAFGVWEKLKLFSALILEKRLKFAIKQVYKGSSDENYQPRLYFDLSLSAAGSNSLPAI